MRMSKGAARAAQIFQQEAWKEGQSIQPKQTSGLPFGKHKGKPFIMIHKEEPSYLPWLMRQAWLLADTRKKVGEWLDRRNCR